MTAEFSSNRRIRRLEIAATIKKIHLHNFAIQAKGLQVNQLAAVKVTINSVAVIGAGAVGILVS